MTSNQIIQAAIPNADSAVCDFVLWNRTSFPFGRLTARDLYRAASGFHRASEHGIRLCEMCHNKVNKETYLCDKCAGYMEACK